MKLRDLECDPGTLIGPVDGRVVADLHARYPLEAEFLAYMEACHGGVPRIGGLEVDGSWYRVAVFLSLVDSRSELPGPFRPHFGGGGLDERVAGSVSYVKDYDHMTARALFPGLLPFAACQSDMQLDHAYVDLFCLDYRQHRVPRPVVLWDANRALEALMSLGELLAEDGSDEAGVLESVRCDEFIKPVAPDFGSFVERLQPVGIYYCSIRESFRESLAPHHCTPTVRELARAAGRSGGAAVMPVLADALMDAGCDNELILAHCRSGGEHDQGCWVLDLVREQDRVPADPDHSTGP